MDKNLIIQRVLEDPRIRIETAKQSFEWFFNIYLNSFITYETAPFQKRIFEIAQDEQEHLSIIVSFRGSAKTTIMALGYPIWAILGRMQKKFVVIVCDTQDLARQRLANIRSQLESNALLRRELGPFKDDVGQWGAGSLSIPKYGARITVASREQSIRGSIHDQYRPDLIILDDVENLEIVKTKEGRDKLDDWFHNDIMPLGSLNTKIVIIGNLLHEDSMIMRQKELIERGEMSGGYYQFPVRIGDHILWPGKYPNLEALERAQKQLGNLRSWLREYELRIIPDDDQIIQGGWIQYYETLPQVLKGQTTYLATGIDLALIKSTTADFTAMVTARIIVHNDQYKIYILPHPVNKRINFPEQREQVINLVRSFKEPYHYLFIESFGTQGALVEELVRLNYKAEGVTPPGSKAERLKYVSDLVRNGTVLFPKTGTEELRQQLLGFGVEKHEDLADAFAILLFKIRDGKRRGGYSGGRIKMGNIREQMYGLRVHGHQSADWADREDGTMLRRTNPRGNWRRLMG